MNHLNCPVNVLYFDTVVQSDALHFSTNPSYIVVRSLSIHMHVVDYMVIGLCLEENALKRVWV